MTFDTFYLRGNTGMYKKLISFVIVALMCLQFGIPNGQKNSELEYNSSNESIVFDGWNQGSQEGSILSQSTVTIGGGDNMVDGDEKEFVCIIHEISFEIYCWGENDHGQLGLSDLDNKARPVGASSLPPAASIDAGGRHACGIVTGALTNTANWQNSDIFCWGANDVGQFGHPGFTNTGLAYTPVHGALSWVNDGDIDWSVYSALAISSGGGSTCAILVDNQHTKSLWCWGQIVSGNSGSISPPDYQGTCFLGQIRDLTQSVCVSEPTDWDADGDGWAEHLSTGNWGYTDSAFGQGDCNNYIDTIYPGHPEIVGDNVDNDCDGSVDEGSPPTQINLPSSSEPIQVSVGTTHACVITNDQSLHCWGDNDFNQLGASAANFPFIGHEFLGTNTLLDFSNLAINGQTPSPVRVAAGGEHTCAILSDDSVACWGQYTGAFPNSVLNPSRIAGSSDPNWVPTQDWDEVYGQTHALVPISISAGRGHTCITAHNTALLPFMTPQSTVVPQIRPVGICWGSGDKGQLGQGFSDTADYFEYKVIHANTRLSSMTWWQDSTLVIAGGDTTCAVRSVSDPAIRCFGSNDAGTYGHDRVWSDFDWTNACSNSGGNDEPYCDSRAALSQAGTTSGVSVENDIHSEADVLDFDMTQDTGCYIRAHINFGTPQNKMYCWGISIHTPYSSSNSIHPGYQYGTNSLDSDRLPQEIIMPPGLSPQKVKVSANWACAIMDDNTVWCWGEEMIIPDLTLDSTDRENCAYHSLNSYTTLNNVAGHGWYCNGNFRSGDGGSSDLHQIPLVGATALNLGFTTGCASTTTGKVICWGANELSGMKQAAHVPATWMGGYPSTSPSSGTGGNSNFATQTWELLDGQTPTTTVPSGTGTDYDTIFSSDRGGSFVDILGQNMCIRTISSQIVCYGSQVGVLNTPFDENKVVTWLDTDDPAYLDGSSLFGSTITSVAKNIWSICVTLSSNEIYCAGENRYGQLGNGAITYDSLGHDWSQVTVPVGKTFDRLVTNDAHSICAWDSANPTSENLFCWGSNFAELPVGEGCGTSNSVTTPWIPCYSSTKDIIATPTPAYLLFGTETISKIQLNNYGGCALTNGDLGCWGHQNYGNNGCVMADDVSPGVELVIPGCTTELRVHLPGTPNTPPSIASVTITPASGIINTSILVCTMSGAMDVDSDPFLPFEYEWVLTTPQGQVYTYSDTSTSYNYQLDLSATVYSNVFGHWASPGDMIQCIVTITDQFYASSSTQSNTVTVMGAKYVDMDNDGYGDINSAPLLTNYCEANVDCDPAGTPGSLHTGICSGNVCDLGPGYSDNNLDCDDSNPQINPGKVEDPFNGIDDNCDGQSAPLYLDLDWDGFGDIDQPLIPTCGANLPNCLGQTGSGYGCVTHLGVQTCQQLTHNLVVCTTVTGCNVYFQQVSTGKNHACGLTTTGDIFCFGAGQTDTNCNPIPGATTNIECGQSKGGGGAYMLSASASDKWASLTVGEFHTCAITVSGDADCWGWDFIDNDGDGEMDDPPTSQFVQISAGDSHTCGITNSGLAECWGDWGFSSVVPIPNSQFKSLDSGGRTTCGITVTDTVECWGEFSTSSTPPVGATAFSNDPNNLPTLKSISVGEQGIYGQTFCGLTIGEQVRCWNPSIAYSSPNTGPGWFVSPNNNQQIADIDISGDYYCGLDVGTGHVVSGGILCYSPHHVGSWLGNMIGTWSSQTCSSYTESVVCQLPSGTIDSFSVGGGNICVITSQASIACSGTIASTWQLPSFTVQACYGLDSPPGSSGYCSVPNYVPIPTPNDIDCNDQDSSINPGQSETQGNNVDDNCDGQVDESPTPRALFPLIIINLPIIGFTGAGLVLAMYIFRSRIG